MPLKQTKLGVRLGNGSRTVSSASVSKIALFVKLLLSKLHTGCGQTAAMLGLWGFLPNRE
jgi:hypothetical protein